MTDDVDLDAICTEYLERLRGSLGDLSDEDRRQIFGQVSEHISTARDALPQQTEAAVREILDRLGTPQEIAASAVLEGEEPSPGGPRLLVGAVVVVVLVVFGVGIAALAGAFSTSAPSSGRTIGNGPSTSTTDAPVGTEVVPTLLGDPLAQAIQTLHILGLGYIVSYTQISLLKRWALAAIPALWHSYAMSAINPATAHTWCRS